MFRLLPKCANWTAFLPTAGRQLPAARLFILMQFTLLLILLFDPSYSYFTDSLLTQIVGGRKPYGIRRRRWDREQLTWRLDTKNINAGDEYILSEKENGGPTDLVVAFERGKHADEFPFDGKDGIVAHAFFPRDGRLHFDADEEWTLNSPYGVNLFQTAVHEVGHLLGLPHSKDPTAVMNVAKRPYDPDFRLGEFLCDPRDLSQREQNQKKLGEDDIRAVQCLYPMEEKDTSPSNPSTFPFALPSTVRRYQRQFHFLKL